MKDESERLWSTPGTSTTVVPGLIQRIGFHSPDLVLLIQQYLQSHGETLHDRTTYSEGDPSLRMVFFLVEALLNFERLRVELLEQTQGAHDGGKVVPGHLMIALSEILVFEPALLQNLSTAFEIHLHVWDAVSSDILVPEKAESSDEEDRGRWGTPAAKDES